MDRVEEALYDEPEGSAEERRASQRAARSLAAKVAKVHGALPMPLAAQQLLTATASNDYKVHEVVRIIGSDPMMASRVMRQVNAALGGRTRCASISQAVTLLGVRSIRTTALAASVFEALGDDEKPLIAQEISHATKTALFARALSTAAGLAPEEAYTCGLLHDVGRLFLLRGNDLDYADLLRRCGGVNELHHEERTLYGYDHALVAGHVLSAWKLPHPIPRVVAWHHQPRRAFAASGAVPQLVSIVRIADQLAHLSGSEGPPDPERLRAALGAMTEELGLLGLSTEVLVPLSEALAETELTMPEPRGHAPPGAPTQEHKDPAVHERPPPLPARVQPAAVSPEEPEQSEPRDADTSTSVVDATAGQHSAVDQGAGPEAEAEAPAENEAEAERDDAEPEAEAPAEHETLAEPGDEPEAPAEPAPSWPGAVEALGGARVGTSTWRSFPAQAPAPFVPDADDGPGPVTTLTGTKDRSEPSVLASSPLLTLPWPVAPESVTSTMVELGPRAAEHTIIMAPEDTPVASAPSPPPIMPLGADAAPVLGTGTVAETTPSAHEPLASTVSTSMWRPWFQALAQGTAMASMILGGSLLEFLGARGADPMVHALCIAVPPAMAFAFGISWRLHTRQ